MRQNKIKEKSIIKVGDKFYKMMKGKKISITILNLHTIHIFLLKFIRSLSTNITSMGHINIFFKKVNRSSI